MSKRKWDNVPGLFAAEVVAFSGQVWDFYDDKRPVTPLLPYYQQILGADDAELNLEFLSSGYEDTGRITADPYDSYPPEGSEYREVVNAYLLINDGPKSQKQRQKILLPKDIMDSLAKLYQEEIYLTEMRPSYDYDS